MKHLAFLTALLLTSLTYASDRGDPQRTVPLMRYCDVATDVAGFRNKEIRLRAIYRVGFEWAEFYSIACIDAPSTWVEFSDLAVDCSPRRSLKRLKGGDVGVTAGVVVRGRFTGGHVGQLNGYANEFVVDCVESVEVLAKESPSRNALSKALRERIQRFEDQVPQ